MTIKRMIEGTKTPDMPEGIIATKAGALAFAKRLMPADLKRAGFEPSIFDGARGWVINYGMTVNRNPRPRLGTAKPTRKSQATGKKPSARLVARRRANKIAGVYPNPDPLAYEMLPVRLYKHASSRSSKWVEFARYDTLAAGREAARVYANKHQTVVRVWTEGDDPV